MLEERPVAEYPSTSPTGASNHLLHPDAMLLFDRSTLDQLLWPGQWHWLRANWKTCQDTCAVPSQAEGKLWLRHMHIVLRLQMLQWCTCRWTLHNCFLRGLWPVHTTWQLQTVTVHFIINNGNKCASMVFANICMCIRDLRLPALVEGLSVFEMVEEKLIAN